MKPYINNYSDVLDFLDDLVEQISWDKFYTKRMPTPFILQNDMPDENLKELVETSSIHTALELGCGEGRNAIFLASKEIDVTAIDKSSVAIENAKALAIQKDVNVNFQCINAFEFTSDKKYDLIYDSGMFHHLAPHRRITYVEMIKHLLNPSGLLGLTCFAWGDKASHGADEIDDWEFYNKKRVGIAYTPERLKEIFADALELVSIRKMKDGVPDTIQGLTFMWAALFTNIKKAINKI